MKNLKNGSRPRRTEKKVARTGTWRKPPLLGLGGWRGGLGGRRTLSHAGGGVLAGQPRAAGRTWPPGSPLTEHASADPARARGAGRALPVDDQPNRAW